MDLFERDLWDGEMKLTVSHKGKQDLTILDLVEEDFKKIKGYVRDFLESRSVKKCNFKLEGEAEFVRDVSLCCLFG